ncbi:MAG: hypothetical protein J6Q82_06330 [Clostridia bacterium]|nr:hypothetical protein [Clostridia bacterium]
MESFLGGMIVGLLCIVLGAINMTGNLTTLHRYHRHRVSEENRVPYGRTVGLGSILCGVGLVLFSVLSLSSAVLGTVALIVFLAVGLGLTFWAMFKYNGGIF